MATKDLEGLDWSSEMGQEIIASKVEHRTGWVELIRVPLRQVLLCQLPERVS